MGTTTLNTAIENKFNTAWASATPIAFENVAFTPPVASSWVHLYVRDGDSEKITIGSSVQRRRTLGTIFVDIFTVVGAGSKPARDLADNVAAIFRDLVISGVTCREPSTMIWGEKYYTNSGTGVPATSQWYQVTVAIPFMYDQVL